jgi:hypothetical protein
MPVHAWARTAVKKIAVLDFALVDTSMAGQMWGTDPVDRTRLRLLESQVRKTLAKSGKYTVLDIRPHRALTERLRAKQDFFDCHGCDLDVGKALGADLVLVGWVQKVSNLVLYLSMVMRNVHTGKLGRQGSVELKGNSDATWNEGATYVLKYDILSNPAGADRM